MKLLSIFLGKTLIKLSRLFGSNGSALPGLVIEKLYPKFLEVSLNSIREGVVVVTGTNGKTTTTKMLVSILEGQGMRVLSNPTGSNFTRGVISTVLDKMSYSGKLDYEIAVLELDEAFSRIFVKSVKPRYVLLLNVMRDQLDRYGEIDTTARMMEETAQAATLGVIVNQDDPRLEEIAQGIKAKVTYFGASNELQKLLPTDDMMHSEDTLSEADYSSEIELTTYEHQKATYTIAGKRATANLQTAGIHNALNSAGAIATVYAMNPKIDLEALMHGVEQVHPAWGRGEVCRVGDTTITLALVKNPAGMQQSVTSYSDDASEVTIFAINDKFADGRDVSWLWDVDYTTLSSDTKLYTTGVRAYDMALRLMYDNKSIESINEQKEQLLQQIIDKTPKTITIFCTYTAMLDIRKYLGKITELESEVWG